MKSLKKQQGFAMIASVFIVIGVVTFFAMSIAETSSKHRIKTNADSFYNRIIYLRTQVHAFVNDRYLEGHRINGAAIFPHELAALEPKYIPMCTDADNQKGFCMKVNQTPWGMIEGSDYRVVAVPKDDGSAVSHYRAEFDVKLPDEDDKALKYERRSTISMLTKIPNIFYDDANNLITVRIDRPDKAFAYESLVKRSGDDSTLLGDWDVGGNFAITNAKDVTIKNGNGTQQSVVQGLTKIYTVEHGQWLRKPPCPQGMTLNSTFSITEINTHPTYSLTGLQRAYLIEENATQIRVGLDVGAKHKFSGAGHTLHLGKVTALLQCK